MARQSGCISRLAVPSGSCARQTLATLWRVTSLKRMVRHSCTRRLSSCGRGQLAACAVTATVPLPQLDSSLKTVAPACQCHSSRAALLYLPMLKR